MKNLLEKINNDEDLNKLNLSKEEIEIYKFDLIKYFEDLKKCSSIKEDICNIDHMTLYRDLFSKKVYRKKFLCNKQKELEKKVSRLTYFSDFDLMQKVISSNKAKISKLEKEYKKNVDRSLPEKCFIVDKDDNRNNLIFEYLISRLFLENKEAKIAYIEFPELIELIIEENQDIINKIKKTQYLFINHLNFSNINDKVLINKIFDFFESRNNYEFFNFISSKRSIQEHKIILNKLIYDKEFVKLFIDNLNEITSNK